MLSITAEFSPASSPQKSPTSSQIAQKIMDKLSNELNNAQYTFKDDVVLVDDFNSKRTAERKPILNTKNFFTTNDYLMTTDATRRTRSSVKLSKNKPLTAEKKSGNNHHQMKLRFKSAVQR